jgi:hypothetical protein
MMILYRALGGVCLLSCLVLPTGCSSSGALENATPAQTAHIDYVAATAALDDAVAVASVKGLSPSAIAKIQAGGAAFEAAVEADIDALLTSGTVATEAESAAAAAISGVAGDFGTVLTAVHGSDVTPTDLAVAGGLGALQQLPAVLAAVVAVQDGYQPSAADLAADLAALQDAERRLAALTAG